MHRRPRQDEKTTSDEEAAILREAERDFESATEASHQESEQAFDPDEFLAAEAEKLGIAGLTASEVYAKRPQDLDRGPAESRLGGKISRDLQLPSPEERRVLRQKSMDLASRSAVYEPDADEESEQRPGRRLRTRLLRR